MSRPRLPWRPLLVAAALAGCAGNGGDGDHDRSDYSPENAESRCAREARRQGYEVLGVKGTKRLGAMAIEVRMQVDDGRGARVKACVYDINVGEARLL
jgi:hypothetical protein